MKIVFIGSVEFSEKALLKLIQLNSHIVGVITKKSSKVNSDHVDLSKVAIKYNIPYKYVKDINHPTTLEWVRNLHPDVIFCFGWSYLIKQQLLNLTNIGVIGFHPTLLPKNKGRHPIIWALALGLGKTGSTFFFMDEGADTGDILDQEEINILFEDDARTLYNKVSETALLQIERFLPRLSNNTFFRVPQSPQESNNWRKRSKDDGFIDFRMDSIAIYNLVRALTHPYVGAHLIYKGMEIKVWEVKISDFYKNNIEPGKVIQVIGDEIEIKTRDGSIILLNHDFEVLPKVSEYLTGN